MNKDILYFCICKFVSSRICLVWELLCCRSLSPGGKVGRVSDLGSVYGTRRANFISWYPPGDLLAIPVYGSRRRPLHPVPSPSLARR